MRILEVRDGFIKFESGEKISLSSFILVNGFDKQYIAQVIQVKKSGENLIAYAKILFLYDGTLRNYDKSLPDKNSEISEFTADILSNSLISTNPVIAGRFFDKSIDIPIDKECFNKKTLVCVDKPHSNNIILSNLARQFKAYGRVIVIDMLGVAEGKKFTAGVDFSLPLNLEGLSFMYEDCLNDTTPESKAMIKEIFLDLGEYAKTVPFLPFSALKTVVDDLVDKSHIFKLLVLKNKLAKFDKDGCFAKTKAEAENLDKILESDFAIIDLSKLDSTFQNRYLSCILSALAKQKDSVQIFLESSNLINKKNMKTVLTNDAISAVFMTHSKFKYINEIKNLFDNFIIEPSFTANQVFNIYNTFLNSMPNDTYLLVGEGTNYIPLVSSLEEITTVIKTKTEESPAIEVSNEISDETEELTVEELENEVTEEIAKEELESSEEVNVQLEPTAEAIEKKSDNLIEKLTEEVQSAEIPANLNLFDDESENTEAVVNLGAEVNANIDAPENNLSEASTAPYGEVLQEVVIETESDTPEDVVQSSVPEAAQVVENFETKVHQDSETLAEESETESLQPDEATPVEELELDLQDSDIELAEPVIENVPEDSLPETEQAEEITLPEEISDLIDEEPEQNHEIPALKEFEEDSSETTVIPINEDNSELDELIELDPDSETDEEPILVDLGDESEELSEEELDKQIVEDVDKVFTTMKEDDAISDSDLDFIDELNEESNSEGLEELTPSEGLEELQPIEDETDDDSFLEPLEEVGNKPEPDDSGEILETRSSSTPIVPVYEADIPPEDMVSSDPIEQGDTVTHAKYGTGVVEKMIKYGTKTLYSINFDNIGRRLLDPTLTEIKKS